MAILKNTVQVNNGNTGWTRTNVLNALEEAIADLGWHSGSQTNGIVTTCHAPGRSGVPYLYEPDDSSQWDHCGGTFTSFPTSVNSKYFVTVDSGAYKFQRFHIGGSVPSTNDYINIGQHGMPDGTAVVYRAINSQATPLSPSISDGDTVYIVKHSVNDTNSIALCASQADALADPYVPINDLNSLASGEFVLIDGRHTDNTKLMSIYQGDSVQLYTAADYDTVRGSDSNISSTHPLFIQDSSGAYNADRVLSFTNYNPLPYNYAAGTRDMPAVDGVMQDTTTGWDGSTFGDEIIWDTRGWEQGNYYIVCKNHSGMTVEVPLLATPGRMSGWSGGYYKNTDQPNEFGIQQPYYDYTVPASGSRSALNLRIYRNYQQNPAPIEGIRVLNMNSSGWTDDDTFTIPGTAIGGSSPANDITFGVNADESSSGAADGTPSVRIWNKGAGVNAYWKDTSQSKLLWRCENDAAKDYGVTYFLFELTSDYEMSIKSGVEPWFDNLMASGTTNSSYGPRFGGQKGLDWCASQNTMVTSSSFQSSYATSSTPTAYPLKVVTYRAQSPQDTEFAVIQFVQSINGDDIPYFTWFHHKGNQYGSGIWDLDYVWQGGFTKIGGYNQSIQMTTQNAQQRNEEDDPFDQSIREALYGYLRTTSNSVASIQYELTHNFYESEDILYSRVKPYLRGDAIDKVNYGAYHPYYQGNLNDATATATGDKNEWTGGEVAMTSSANFYKPLKGIPLSVNISPIPYYLPDDFVAIPFDITPGQANIRAGDIITISASEVYEVVQYSYTQLAETYDGITDNRTKGTLFCARTT